MPYQIALAWSPECEAELKEKGFEKREIYIREAPSCDPGDRSIPDPQREVVSMVPPLRPGDRGISDLQCKAGDADFFGMTHKPFQFITTSYWGSSNE